MKNKTAYSTNDSNQSLLLHEIIKNTSKDYPNKSILRMRKNGEWRSWSFSTVMNEEQYYAKILTHLGINKGDRIIIFSENLPQTIITFLAILEISGTVVLIDPTLPIDDLNNLILHIDSRCITVTNKHVHLLKKMRGINIPVLTIESNLQANENFPQ